MGLFSSKKGSGNVKTTREHGISGTGWTPAYFKTGNGKESACGKTPAESNRNFQKACKKNK